MSKWNNKYFLRKYARNWYRTHKDHYSSPKVLAHRREYNKERYAKNPRKILDYAKRWRLNNPGKNIIYQRKSKYGLTEEQQKKILMKLCGLCEKQKITDIDHCHKTGRVRGGLCRSCNLGLGYFKEDKKLLRKAIKWLA